MFENTHSLLLSTPTHLRVSLSLSLSLSLCLSLRIITILLMEQLPHFLLIPYSEQGHFNPMLSLASQLAALGCKVTFVKAERQAITSLHADTCKASEVPESQAGASSASKYCQAADAKLRAEASQEDDSMRTAPQQTNNEMPLLANLQFVTLPARKNTELGSGDPSTISRHEMFKKTLAGLEERQDLVAKIVEDSKASPHPISCVICDLLLWRWVRHVANDYGLRSAVLSIFSAFTLYTLYLRFVIGKEIEIEVEDLLVSGFGMPSLKDIAAYYALTTMSDTPELKLKKHKFLKSLFEGMEDVGPILVNSFKDLEAPLLPSLDTLSLDVRFIGPCLPAWNENDVGLGSKLAQQAGSIFIEEEAGLPWLDLQEKGSVLFVSFGSEGTIEAKQVEEIAMGIEKSGYKFLWVFRSDAPSSSGPTQIFREKSSKHEKGLFVSWAPQRKVLQHPSIGGFLTHSGWNSTLESVTFGVPMLCLPLLGDHPVNANFVQDHLKVGMRITISQDGMVNREEVANGVQAIMKGQFSDHISKFHQASQLALQDAHHTLVSFVQDMTHT